MSIQPNALVALDFGGTSIKLGLLAGPRVLVTAEIPPSGTPGDLDVVRSAIERLRTAAGLSATYAGVGIAVPGIVDRARGTLTAAHGKYPWAHGFNLVGWAEETFDAPAAIDNDARAALAGEHRYGIAASHPDAVVMTLGTGIGTAAIMGGKAVRGSDDHASVLGGHLTLQLDGPPCNCGNVGCAEALASTWALPRVVREHPAIDAHPHWRRRLDEGRLGLREVFTAPSSDAFAADIAARFVRTWGATLLGLCHAYDPTVVVVTGGVMRSADRILPGLRHHLDSHLWSTSRRPLVYAPAHPEHSVLIGLAAIAENHTEETR